MQIFILHLTCISKYGHVYIKNPLNLFTACICLSLWPIKKYSFRSHFHVAIQSIPKRAFNVQGQFYFLSEVEFYQKTGNTNRPTVKEIKGYLELLLTFANRTIRTVVISINKIVLWLTAITFFFVSVKILGINSCSFTEYRKPLLFIVRNEFKFTYDIQSKSVLFTLRRDNKLKTAWHEMRSNMQMTCIFSTRCQI